ncbi:MAG: carboxypeptidase regulatory-like domain-containing protein, partial [Chloroflexi bacterium]|nr:carboxypeptidase regulatory-like domain-containing protein [Chloroflexota bacterium]
MQRQIALSWLAILLLSLLAAVPLLAAGTPYDRLDWAAYNLVYPATVTVSGTVRDNGGAPVAGATVQVVDPGTQQVVGAAVTGSNGSYTIAVPPGTYDVRVVPPAGSGFQTAVALGRSITGNTVLDFVLVPAGVATLSGTVRDRFGAGLPDQRIRLTPAGGGSELWATTDVSGT